MQTEDARKGSQASSDDNRGMMDVALVECEGEPCALDLDLAARLGFARPRDIKKLIERKRDELETYGPLRHRGAMVDIGSGAKREVQEYLLNEEQSLLVAVLSDAPKAPAVRSMLIRVFVAWRRGHLDPAPTEIDVRTNGIVKQMNGKVAGLERSVASLQQMVTGLLIAHDAHRAVLDYVSVRQMLDEGKAISKRRNSLNRRFGHALKHLALIAAEKGASPARKCPHSGVWLYQRDFAAKFMRERGGALVADHNASVMGQGVISFPSRRRSEGADASPA